MVAWLQTHRLLAAHGAEATLPSFLAVAVLVEVGPILAGLLAAARMGAGLAAELGSMVLNEEIDARIVLGADPVPTLVAPRAIACALAVPLLTVIIDASALLGSLAAELAAGKSTIPLFWNKALVFLRLSDIVPATLKTAVFGLVVGLFACWTGLNADRSTEAVGRAAIRGVVRAILGSSPPTWFMVPLHPDTCHEAIGVWASDRSRSSMLSMARGATAMRGGIGRWRALANAGFAMAVLALAGFGLYQVAGRQWQVQPTFHVRAQFETIGGLEVGHRVRIQGIDAGVVERIVAPAEPGQPVELVLRVDERLRHLVRTDAVARIVSEGLVGAKVVELSPGRPDAPRPGRARHDRLRAADRDQRPDQEGRFARWRGSTPPRQAAEQGLGELNAIAGSIRRGEGSLGKLVRDESAYQSLVDLAHRGERSSDGPGRKPDRPQADLAAVALL